MSSDISADVVMTAPPRCQTWGLAPASSGRSGDVALSQQNSWRASGRRLDDTSYVSRRPAAASLEWSGGRF